MGVFISGLLGAIASAGAWFGLEHFMEKEFGWLACAVGLVTGLAVHAAAAKPGGAGYARGAMAALLTLAAIVGGPRVKAEVMMVANKEVPVKSAAQDPVVLPADEDAKEGDAPQDAVADVPAIETAGKRPGEAPRFEGAGLAGQGKQTLKKSLSEWDVIWISGAALVAYIVGKGRDQMPGAPDDQEVPEVPDAPQDQGGDESP